jgi:hypothetical protein
LDIFLFGSGGTEGYSFPTITTCTCQPTVNDQTGGATAVQL